MDELLGVKPAFRGSAAQAVLVEIELPPGACDREVPVPVLPGNQKLFTGKIERFQVPIDLTAVRTSLSTLLQNANMLTFGMLSFEYPAGVCAKILFERSFSFHSI